MSALIARVRVMIFDTGGSPLLSDDIIQDKLDECRTEAFGSGRYLLLTPRPTFSKTLGIQYNDYYAMVGSEQRGMWEADETFIWGDFTPLTPTSSDELVGHWTFNNQLPPVLLAGKTYDLYRAAADLGDYKIAALAATQVDFTADGQSFHLSQQITTLQKLLCDYRRKQRARLGALGRSDGPEQRALGIAPNQAELAGPVSANVPFLTGE
jgi:hypothetical protein